MYLLTKKIFGLYNTSENSYTFEQLLITGLIIPDINILGKCLYDIYGLYDNSIKGNNVYSRYTNVYIVHFINAVINPKAMYKYIQRFVVSVILYECIMFT